MSFKRSRKEMSSTMTVKSKTKAKEKKRVQFSDATTSIPPSRSSTRSSTSTSTSTSMLWYTPGELSSQLEASKEPVAEWVANGYGILVAHSYLQPHVNVQEYLNAYCAGKATGSLRGLESSLAADLRQERSQTRDEHVQKVLDAQAQRADAEALYVCSRQSSAPSKLFAMRMGRADARHAEENPLAAQELVQEHLARQEKRLSRASSNSSNSSCSSNSSYNPGFGPKKFTTHILAPLPVHEIVLTKFPQSQAA